MRFLYAFYFLFISYSLAAQEHDTRWQQTDGNAITWTIEGSNLPHSDNIEMSGRRVSGIISYEVDEKGMLNLHRKVIYPQLHPYIKESDPDWYVYRSYLTENYGDEVLPKLYIKDRQLSPGPLTKVTIDGMITFEHAPSKSGISLSRKLYPSTTLGAFIEEITLLNTTAKNIEIYTPLSVQAAEYESAAGTYASGVVSGVGFAPTKLVLEANNRVTITVRMFSDIKGDKDLDSIITRDVSEIKKARQDFLLEMSSNLILETPNPVLNLLFEFSKIRASESIFDSKLGAIHSPGGGRYYVGIWANDQAEYVSPFFPYLGYDLGNESALNMYRAFDSVKSPAYDAIQYAFEVEELQPPSLLDRGDAAMIAYGASQYLLARASQEEAQELWPLIAWCLEYNHRKLNASGVVASQSDEMEGRIETGTANLSTSALYYGGLQNAIYLAKELGQDSKIIATFQKRMNALEVAIETYFGANIEGLDTYKYYEEHSTLRHWICLPLVMDINTRSKATTEALFDRLWTDNGVHVEKNNADPKISKIFWDRGTLYALRGTFRTGATEKSLARLEQFSKERLLGERVPYVVEAYPEGAMAHLSAESGLYCRVFTEGLFAITPTSFNSFTIQPRLPDGWNEMALRHIRLFGKDFDIEVTRKGSKTQVDIINHDTGIVVFSKKSKLEKPMSVQLK
jgi:hypothetical protein